MGFLPHAIQGWAEVGLQCECVKQSERGCSKDHDMPAQLHTNNCPPPLAHPGYKDRLRTHEDTCHERNLKVLVEFRPLGHTHSLGCCCVLGTMGSSGVPTRPGHPERQLPWAPSPAPAQAPGHMGSAPSEN